VTTMTTDMAKSKGNPDDSADEVAMMLVGLVIFVNPRLHTLDVSAQDYVFAHELGHLWHGHGGAICGEHRRVGLGAHRLCLARARSGGGDRLVHVGPLAAANAGTGTTRNRGRRVRARLVGEETWTRGKAALERAGRCGVSADRRA
jgi:hypothetical protein